MAFLRSCILLVAVAHAVQFPGKQALQALQAAAARQDPVASLGDLFNQAKASAAAAAQSIVNQASDAVEDRLRNSSNLLPFAHQLADAVDSLGDRVNDTLHSARGNTTDTLDLKGLADKAASTASEATQMVVDQAHKATKSAAAAEQSATETLERIRIEGLGVKVSNSSEVASQEAAVSKTVIVVAQPAPPPVVTRVREYGSLVRSSITDAEGAALDAARLESQAEESASTYVRAVVNATLAAEAAAKSLQDLSDTVTASVEATKETATILDKLLRTGSPANASIVYSAKVAESAAMEAVEAAGFAVESAAERDLRDRIAVKAKEANLDDVRAVASKVNHTLEASRRAAKALEDQAGNPEGIAPAGIAPVVSPLRSNAVARRSSGIALMSIISAASAVVAVPLRAR